MARRAEVKLVSGVLIAMAALFFQCGDPNESVDADGDGDVDVDVDGDGEIDGDIDGDSDGDSDLLDGDGDVELPDRIEVLNLGEVTGGEELAIEVPEGTKGFHIVLSSTEFDPELADWFGVETLVSPSGELVVDTYCVLPGTNTKALGTSGIATVSVPQSSLESAMPPESGTWIATIGTMFELDGPVTADVYLRIGTSVDFFGGIVDLHLYIPEGLEIEGPDQLHTVTDAESDNCIQERVAAFFENLETIYGLSRGGAYFSRNRTRVSAYRRLRE